MTTWITSSLSFQHGISLSGIRSPYMVMTHRQSCWGNISVWCYSAWWHRLRGRHTDGCLYWWDLSSCNFLSHIIFTLWIWLPVHCYKFRIDSMSITTPLLLPPSQNKCLKFVLALVQSCTKLKTVILGRREYMFLSFPSFLWPHMLLLELIWEQLASNDC